MRLTSIRPSLSQVLWELCYCEKVLKAVGPLAVAVMRIHGDSAAVPSFDSPPPGGESFNVRQRVAMAETLESCWASDPEERPTAEHLFTALSEMVAEMDSEA